MGRFEELSRPLKEISDLRIDRFSPQCFIGNVEALCRWKFGIPDLGRLWIGHNTAYLRRWSTMGCLEDGKTLNVALGRLLLDQETILGRLRQYHGICLRTKPYMDLNAAKEDLHTAFRQGDALITEMDHFYLPGRREYHRNGGQHTIILYGFSETGQAFLASEQMLGNIRFPLEDYSDYIQDLVIRRGMQLHLVRVTRPDSGTGRLDLAAVQRDLDWTVTDWEAGNGRLGLSALRAFLKDISAFLDSREGATSSPLYLPGMWTFSHEKAHAVKFLKAFRKDFAAEHLSDLLAEMESLLHQLQGRWLEADLKIEMGLNRNNAAFSVEAMEIIRLILPLEADWINACRKLRVECDSIRYRVTAGG